MTQQIGGRCCSVRTSPELLFVAAIAAVLSTGCGATVGKVALNQDPTITWVQSPVGQVDATLLANQRIGSAAATESWAAEAKCSQAGFAGRTDEVVAAHNAFTKKEPRAVAAKWVTDAIDTQGMVASLVAREVNIGLGGKSFAPVPWNAGAAFNDLQTGLVIARVAHKAVLSDDAVACVTGAMCRTQQRGARVKYVRGVYYGNLIRLELAKKGFSLSGSAVTPQAVNASFELKASDMSMSGSIVGLLNTQRGKLDVPFILEHLGQEKLVAVEQELVAAADKFGVIAIEQSEATCE